MVFPTPFVLGHEPAGIVEAVGPGVKHVAPGDSRGGVPVGVLRTLCQLPHRPREPVLQRRLRAAHPTPRPGCTTATRPVHQFVGLSSFAESMLLSQHNVVKIDPALPLSRACLLGCGVLTGVGAALNTAQVTAGSTVAVIGCGGVGLSVIQGARLAYARRIIAVDVDDEKLDLARRCGATDVVNARNEDAVAAVQGLTMGGVDFAFEAIGQPPTIQQALAMTGPGGTMTVVGIADPTDQFSFTGLDLMMGKTIKQSLMGSAPFGADIPALVQHALAGRLDLDIMVSAEHGPRRPPGRPRPARGRRGARPCGHHVLKRPGRRKRWTGSSSSRVIRTR